MDKAIEYSLEKLGYNTLRPNQDIVIKQYLQGHDILFCSPTGSGKSLLFEVAPFLHQYIENKVDQCTCLVISPLSALMKSPVQRLISKGIKAVYLKDGDSKDILYEVTMGK